MIYSRDSDWPVVHWKQKRVKYKFSLCKASFTIRLHDQMQPIYIKLYYFVFAKFCFPRPENVYNFLIIHFIPFCFWRYVTSFYKYLIIYIFDSDN